MEKEKKRDTYIMYSIKNIQEDEIQILAGNARCVFCTELENIDHWFFVCSMAKYLPWLWSWVLHVAQVLLNSKGSG